MVEASSPKSQKRTRNRGWIIWLVLIALIFVTLTLPFWAGRWHGHRVKQELMAKGEKLYRNEFKWAPILDPENYFAIPYFKEAVADERTFSNHLKRPRTSELLSKVDRNRNPVRKVGDPFQPSDFSEYSVGGRVAGWEWLENTVVPWETVRRDLLVERSRPRSVSTVDFEHPSHGHLNAAVGEVTWFCLMHSVLALGRKDSAAALEDVLILERVTRAIPENQVALNGWVVREAWESIGEIARDGIHLWSEEELLMLDSILSRAPSDGRLLSSSFRESRAWINSGLGRTLEGQNPSETGFHEPLPMTTRYAGLIQLGNFNLRLQELIECLETPGAVPADFDRIAPSAM